MHYKIFLCVLLFPVSLSAQNGELSLTLEQSASLMNKGSRTLQMADKAVDIARSERQKMNAFWYPSLNASGAYVHLSNHIEVKEPLRQFTDPAKDFVHSIVPDYNPQIQISAESETKRSIFREKDKTKRSKKESAQHSKSRNKSFVMTSVSAL